MCAGCVGLCGGIRCGDQEGTGVQPVRGIQPQGVDRCVQAEDGGGGEERRVHRRLLRRLRRVQDRESPQVRRGRAEQHDVSQDEGQPARGAGDLLVRALGRRSLRDPRGRGQLLRRARVLPPRGRPLRRPSVGRGRHVGVQGRGPRKPAHRAVQGIRRRQVQAQRRNLPAVLPVLRPLEAPHPHLA